MEKFKCKITYNLDEEEKNIFKTKSENSEDFENEI